MLEALRRWFGFDAFRDGQQDVIERIDAGKDLCVVMPTGAGKSLCYQLPILMRPGYGLVVSPLISLMRDQVEALCARGVAAAYVNSTVPAPVQAQIFTDVRRGIVKILYVAPERFRAARFLQLLRDCPPSLFVVDEAHCISQWGHDFRPDYMRLGGVASELEIGQICAFTATATPRVREDIGASLKRSAMESVVTGFQRPNLSFSVAECRSDTDKLAALDRLLSTPAPTIIYTSTRKAAELVASELDCICYHAGLNPQRRHQAQGRFMQDPCPVLVATNAFGMGIDRPDIRRVIHYNLPGSLEAYYQEAGRAGRDGDAADCVLLFAYRDRFIQEFLIDVNNPDEATLRVVHAALLREHDRTGETCFEMTAAELAALAPVSGSDRTIGGALQVLEKHKVVNRRYLHGSQGTLEFLDSLDTLRQVHQHESTQRSRFIHRLSQHMGSTGKTARFSLDQLARLSGLRLDQVKRVLGALNQETLRWSPPFRGRAIELLEPDKRELEIDFDAIATKRAFELDRLENVLRYTRGMTCRQKILVDYFGQNVGSWRCGTCDNCGGTSAGRELSRSECATVETVLTAVLSLEGGFGRSRVAKMLAEPMGESVGNQRLDTHPQRATLVRLGVGRVRTFIDALLRAGCIGVVGDPEYPCIDITPEGMRVLDGKDTVKLAIPASRPSKRKRPSRPRKASGSGPADSPSTPDPNPDQTEELLSALRDVRTSLAAEKEVPTYRILPNRTLEALARQRPEQVDDALAIKGVGKVKARTIIPAFLQAIREWQKPT